MPRPGRTRTGTARAVSERHMPDHALVERWQDGGFDPDDPYGDGSEGSWTVIHDAAESGRVDLISDRGVDRIVAGAFDLAEPSAAVLPAAWDVQQQDRVTVGETTLSVRAVQRATYDAHLRVIGETVSPDGNGGEGEGS